jgi:hypothetical protein
VKQLIDRIREAKDWIREVKDWMRGMVKRMSKAEAGRRENGLHFIFLV